MGEFELLALLRERLPTAGPRLVLGSGDDAAITVPGGAVATSVDALVEGVHFRRETASLRQIGRKALSTALSDLAAMGAEAGEAYIVLGAPEGMSEAELLELGEGMAAVAGETGTAIAGGDLTRAPVLTLAVTVTGHAARAEDFVTRGGAREGDVLVVTGELGGARRAAAARRPDSRRPRSASTRPPHRVSRPRDERGHGTLDLAVPRPRRRQLDPTPRLAAGRALAAAGATAMIDVSDGLAGDANHVAARERRAPRDRRRRPADRARRRRARRRGRPRRARARRLGRRGLRALRRATARRRRRRPAGARRAGHAAHRHRPGRVRGGPRDRAPSSGGAVAKPCRAVASISLRPRRPR